VNEDWSGQRIPTGEEASVQCSSFLRQLALAQTLVIVSLSLCVSIHMSGYLNSKGIGIILSEGAIF